tara:strand:- start:300 stop:1670 length:1371 start_codon:yes stop_codon:yes gene_type:complete
MFKKIEIWILYLTLLLSILFAIGLSVLVRQELVGSTKAGWISKTALTLAEIPINTLRLLGFGHDLTLEDRFPNLDGFNGTLNSEETYLLLSIYDGDLQEGVVRLVDLRSFKILHTWNPDIDAFNDLIDQTDEFKYMQRDLNNSRYLLYHPLLTKKGDLIFNSINAPLRKIDACSNLVFQNTHDGFHHSVETDIDGNIWTSTHMYPQSLPIEKVGRKTPRENGFKDDAIVKLSPDGEILYEKSISRILIENGMESRLSMVGTSHTFQLDPIHNNDVQPVNVDGKYWKKGDVFISLGHQSMIILWRPSTEEIVWKYESNIFHQHDVNIVSEHQISIFNNNRKYHYPNKDIVDGNNQILIFNFDTDSISSYLSKSLVREDVRTISQGRGQILSNGDLFIEETNDGRTLFFNKDGTLRWTHVNRAEDGNVYRVNWSRILYTREDIQTVNNFLTNKGTCNE